MASFVKVNDFVLHCAHGVHDLSSDQIVVALSNTAPGSESSNPTADGNGVLANVTQVTYTNLSSRDVTTTSSAGSSGTYKLALTDLNLAASGGSVGPFRYVYLYNDDAASDNLIGYYDYGSSITLNDGEDIDIDFSEANGVLTLA